jgi:hypothetical protein
MDDLFGRMLPFKLSVVVCETLPAPSNLMTPTSATGPTGPKTTIEPVVVIPKEPSNLLTEQASYRVSGICHDEANLSASVYDYAIAVNRQAVLEVLRVGARTVRIDAIGAREGQFGNDRAIEAYGVQASEPRHGISCCVPKSCRGGAVLFHI